MKYLVKNKSEYNKLMELLDKVGKYKWCNGSEKPSEFDLYDNWTNDYDNDTEFYIQIDLNEVDEELSYGRLDMSNVHEIPRLMEIEDIEKNSDGIFEIIYSDKSLTLTTNGIYELLVMNETVKHTPIQLPTHICNILDDNNIKYAPLPFAKIEDLLQLRDDYPALDAYCFGDEKHQEKLIDALRYGWEPLPEPLYYIKFYDGDGYLNRLGSHISVNNSESYNGYQTKFTMDEIKAIDARFVPFAVKVED